MTAAPLTDPLSVMFLDWCQAEHVPANTIRARARVLRLLGNAGTATPADVETWWETRRDFAPATRSNDLAQLRTFYRWAQRWGHREDDPTVRLDAPKVPNGLPRPIARADLLRLLEATAKAPDLRRAIALGAYAGLRVSECAALHWHDVDLERRRLLVLGKGQKSREVPAGSVLLDELLPRVDDGYVVTGSTRALSADELRVRINRAIRAAGVDATFHQLRHRYATVALELEPNILAVSRIMGHASVTTTAIYAATSDEVFDRIAAAVAR